MGQDGGGVGWPSRIFDDKVNRYENNGKIISFGGELRGESRILKLERDGFHRSWGLPDVYLL